MALSRGTGKTIARKKLLSRCCRTSANCIAKCFPTRTDANGEIATFRTAMSVFSEEKTHNRESLGGRDENWENSVDTNQANFLVIFSSAISVK